MSKAYIPADVGSNWWKDIPGYKGKYRVSRNADIQRVFPSGLVRNLTPFRKQSKKYRNRLFVHLTIDGKSKEVTVLKIMAETWYNNQDKTLVPYHKNRDVTDNHVDNIGFISRSELGRLTGHMANKKKSVIKISKDGEEVEIYRSARAAAKANNMSYQTVLDRCHNRVKNPFALDGHTYQFEK